MWSAPCLVLEQSESPLIRPSAPLADALLEGLSARRETLVSVYEILSLGLLLLVVEVVRKFAKSEWTLTGTTRGRGGPRRGSRALPRGDGEAAKSRRKRLKT